LPGFKHGLLGLAILRPEIVCAVLALAVWCGEAQAIRFQQRPDWMAGVGWGFGRGLFEESSGGQTTYHDGAAPQIHFGRTFGAHTMVGVNYESWFIEFGTPPIKFRRALQNFGVGLSWFPGHPDGPSGGAYLRGGVGVGWSSLEEVEVIEGEEQGNGVRTDEWGVGVSTGVGYEFWISRNFTTGLGFSFDWFDIGEEIVDQGRFGSFILDMNLYF
jgi:hypothetical protein